MDKSRVAGIAFTALLAFLIVCVDQSIKQFMPIGAEGGFTYIAFIAWAVYFFSGCTLQGGVKAAIAYTLGITFSIVIVLLAGLFGAAGYFALPLGVFVVVNIVLNFDKIPYCDLIPALFIGSGCFFGIMTYVPDATFGTAACVELIYAFIGFTFGWITITGRGLIDKALK